MLLYKLTKQWFNLNSVRKAVRMAAEIFDTHKLRIKSDRKVFTFIANIKFFR
jgi:hypothetical protein